MQCAKNLKQLITVLKRSSEYGRTLRRKPSHLTLLRKKIGTFNLMNITMILFNDLDNIKEIV